MSKNIISTKITIIKGALPEDTSWWTHDDWMKHEKYVSKLKETGEYLLPEEITLNYPEGSFDMFSNNSHPKNNFSNFAILIPTGCSSIPPKFHWEE